MVETFNYVYGPDIDEPFYSFDGTNRNYYYPDGLGSIKRLVSDVGGENTYNYDAWGQLAKSTGTIPNSFGYTGREFTNTDLWYYRARYYEPGSGRFTSTDPLEMVDGSNAYWYVRAIPTMLLDPEGLACGSGWSEIFPDSIPGVFDFEEPCKKHDKCYGKCGNPKRDCDAVFCTELIDDCKNRNFIFRAECLKYATSYCRAVLDYGHDAYEAAQLEDCCTEEEAEK